MKQQDWVMTRLNPGLETHHLVWVAHSLTGRLSATFLLTTSDLQSEAFQGSTCETAFVRGLRQAALMHSSNPWGFRQTAGPQSPERERERLPSNELER